MVIFSTKQKTKYILIKRRQSTDTSNINEQAKQQQFSVPAKSSKYVKNVFDVSCATASINHIKKPIDTEATYGFNACSLRLTSNPSNFQIQLNKILKNARWFEIFFMLHFFTYEILPIEL